MACPDVIDLEQFASNALDDVTRAALDEHVAGCPACSEEIKQLIENLRLAAALRSRKQSADDAPPLDYEPETIGPYRILRKLGQGGMGTVYEAEQDNPRRTVALKVLRQGLVSASMLSRFRREVQTLGRLRHPGIAQIYEAGTHITTYGPQPYFVMELVRGRSLSAFAESKKLPARERLELVARICDAVEHAHQRGVIHRDLKPENILVDDASCDVPQPKILDFGVARMVDPEARAAATLHTTPGQIVGTVAYMSPEQASADSREIDTRADVYALGVICFELLSGTLPYHLSRGNVAASVRAIVEDEPTQLGTLDRTFRGDVTTIVAKALEKDKSRRYQSPAEMAADIRRHLRDEPIAAHAPSTIYQLRKFARRNKGLVAGVVAAFALLVLGVIGTSIGLVRAKRATAIAVTSAAQAKSESAKQVAVNAFLQEMLGAANPRNMTADDRAKGRNVSVLDALNVASKKVDNGALKANPDVELAVRKSMGNAYTEVGQNELAERHFMAALDISRRLYGPDNGDAADVLNGLALLRKSQGKSAEASAFATEALEMSRKVDGENHPNFATANDTVGAMLEFQGKPDEAEPYLRKALELRTRQFGVESREASTSMNNLAFNLDERGKTSEAEPLYRETLAVRRKILGDHPDTATVLNNLGTLVRNKGQLAEAEALYRESLAMRRRTLGEEHPAVTVALNNLAFVLYLQKKYDAAEPIYQEALAMQRKLLGLQHPMVATTLNNIAGLLRDQGRLAEAESALRESIAMRRATLGDAHPTVGNGMYNLAGILLQNNKPAEAEPIAREALAFQVKARGESSPQSTAARLQLGTCLLALGKHEEAERELLTAFQALESRVAATDARAIEARRALVKLYIAWGKPEEAAKYKALPATTQSATKPSTAPRSG